MTANTAVKERVYSADDAFDVALDYFGGDELAAKVWVNKYALKDSAGNLYELSPMDMHRRLAGELARIEKKYPDPLSEDEIFSLLDGFKYLVPQGGPMTGIGNPFQIASLSNCFVIGNEGGSDSYGGIMKMDQEQVQLMKRRGGVGHDLSAIRPSGSPVKNSALTSTGIVPFMERFSNSTREVAQDGRRGALMLSVSIKHPDAEKFIDAKMQDGKVTGANVSVRIDDDFMEAVERGGGYKQAYPVDSKKPSHTNITDAKRLWGKIINNAWQSAEPGVLFWDTITRESVADCYADFGYQTVSTNPCGEIPLCPYDSCRLLAINLFSYVNNRFSDKSSFDMDLFKKHVGFAQRIMDDIVDLELEKIDGIIAKIDSDPEPDEIKATERNLWLNIKKKAQQGRRTGIGITAEGDMLASLGIKYGSDEGNEFSTEIHKTIAIESYRASVQCAKERGAFAIYNSKLEKNNPFVNRLKETDPKLYRDMVRYGRRNIALLTIAPTGSVSLMTQTTSGIEPVFMPVYNRRRKVNANDKDVRVDFVDDVGDSWEEHTVFHHGFKEWMQVAGHDTNKDYSDDEIAALVRKSPYHQATANDVDWLSKVEMQGAVQKWVDHSISVTINLPESASKNLVANLYMKAWQVGCKGVTVYRDGSRSGVLVGKKDKPAPEVITLPSDRPKTLKADVVRFVNEKEDWIAFVGLIDGRPYEIFTGLAGGKDGLDLPKSVDTGYIVKNYNKNDRSRYDLEYIDQFGYKATIEGLSHKFNPEYWNYAKLISGAMRQGMPIENVVELVSSLHLNDDFINTWKNGVVRALKGYIKSGTKATGKTCDDCGSENLTYTEGCLLCSDCGFSECM